MDESSALGILQHLNKEELQQLLDDEVKMAELIQDLAQVIITYSRNDNLSSSHVNVNTCIRYTYNYSPHISLSRGYIYNKYQTTSILFFR